MKVTNAAARWRRRQRLAAITKPLRNIWGWLEPIWPAGALFAALLIILALLRRHYTSFGDVGQGIYVEAWGTLLDILIVGVILSIFNVQRDRKDRIQRYLEEIDDFKKWDNEEARLRIAGNIRRLAKLGKTDIDLSGLLLRDVSLSHQDIDSLKGATFSMGLRLDKMSKNSTHLDSVGFSFVNCSNVIFSRASGRFAGLGLVGKNLTFVDANLEGACFDGAELNWTEYRADRGDWFEVVDVDEDGWEHSHQMYFPAFSSANLTGCSFKYVKFENADFRDAQNIDRADFEGALGLDTCFFDDDVRDQILADAERSRKNTE